MNLLLTRVDAFRNLRPIMRWNIHSNASDVLALGPRTAGRLASVGIRTVSELLAAQAMVVARRLENISVDQFAQWQREASLIVEIPELPAETARLLATADCACAQTLAASTPTELLAKLEVAKQSTDDQWFAQSTMPSVSMASAWIELACQTKKSLAA